jgi:hypothetical protein
LVRFWFYKPKTEKTKKIESNRTKKTGKKPSQNRKTESKPKKQSQTSLNRFFSKKTKQNRIETGQFKPVLVFLKNLV